MFVGGEIFIIKNKYLLFTHPFHESPSCLT
jgi:hypothetical protein